MKKSTIVVLIGGLILLTAFLGPLENEKMYVKQKNFQSVDEVIEVLNTQPLKQISQKKNSYRQEYTDIFEECLSVRKRLTQSGFHAAKLDVDEIVDLDDDEENKILNYYIKLREKFSKRLPISRSEVVRLKVTEYNISDPRTGKLEKVQYDDSSYSILDLVLVDEGEGYVIDFENLYNSDYNPNYTDMSDSSYYDKNEEAYYNEVEDNA